MESRIIITFVVASFVGSGCSPQDSSPEVSAEAMEQEVSAEAMEQEVSAATAASFINRVWVVAESEQVAAGSLRVFLSEGTLVMASSHGTPALGTWNYQGGRLTITEEGLKYDVDILELTEHGFSIRIRSRGEPVEIRFEPAEPPPLPGNAQQPTATSQP